MQIVYDETFGIGQGSYIDYGDIASPGSGTTTNFATGNYSDVAAVTNNSTNNPTAYIVNANIPGSMTNLITFNPLTSTVVSTTPLRSLATPYQRIEGMGLFNPPGTGKAKWDVVLSDNAFPNPVVYNHNDLNLSGTDCSSSLFSGTSNNLPCVAAGIGVGPAGNLGNTQYSIQWEAAGAQIYSRGIGVSTGLPINPNYYQVNGTAISGVTPPNAISSCTNTGKGLLAAWSTLTNVYYKIIGNTYQFKETTGINTISRTGVKIYPNPAQDNITVDGANASESYVIRDMVGRTVLSGVLGNSNSIDVKSLAKGMYVLGLNSIDQHQNMSFVKE